MRVRLRERKAGLCAGWGGIALTILFAWTSFGQRLGTGTNFKAAEYYPAPAEIQMRSLLQAARVQQQTDRRIQLSEMTLQTYATNGTPELLIKAPQCLYDRGEKNASSAGPLRVTTADGKFWIEGIGFSFDQGTSSLVISNQVHTFIDSQMLNTKAEGAATGAAAGQKSSSLEIGSEFFVYSAQSGEGTYERNVKVSGTNQMALQSQRLAFKIPVKERQLQTLQADQQVTLDYAGAHATGEQANYFAATGLVKVSGNPAWKSEQREGRGDVLTLDRTNRVFRADGHAWVRMPVQSLSLSSLLSEPATAPGKATVSTNQFVEVSSGYHEFRTNWAQFGQGVLVTELLEGKPRSTMKCDHLELSYSGTNQLNTLLAEGHFILEEFTNTLSGGRATFDGTNGVLVVTEKPAWRSGLRSGKGETIRVLTRTNDMFVKGNASMRLPAQELARAADPRATASGTRTSTPTAPAWAEVFSGEYNMSPQGVQFRGGVYASHPQMNWACETLTVHLPAEGGQVDQITAETGVAFDLLDNKGQPVHGIGDKAVYSFDVTDGKTNDLLVLTGRPASLQTATSTNRVNTIEYDRGSNVMRNLGNFTISTVVKGTDTNALMLPKTKLTK